jgi:hypothetical protein
MKRPENKLKKKTVFFFRTARDRNPQETDPTTSSILITVTGGIIDQIR